MRAHPFLQSFLLHGVAVVVIVSLTYFAATRQSLEPPPVFIIEPQGASQPTVIGSQDLSLKVNIAVRPAPAPEIAEQVPQPQTQGTPPETLKPTTAPKQRISPTAQSTQPNSTKISYDKYLRNNPLPKNNATKPASGSSQVATPRVDVPVLTDQSGGNSTATGAAASSSQLETYYASLMAELNRARDAADKPAFSDSLAVRVTFTILASGQVTNPRIATPSGSPDFDTFALQLFRRVSPVGPTPTGKAETVTVTFKMNGS